MTIKNSYIDFLLCHPNKLKLIATFQAVKEVIN